MNIHIIDTTKPKIPTDNIKAVPIIVPSWTCDKSKMFVCIKGNIAVNR